MSAPPTKWLSSGLDDDDTMINYMSKQTNFGGTQQQQQQPASFAVKSLDMFSPIAPATKRNPRRSSFAQSAFLVSPGPAIMGVDSTASTPATAKRTGAPLPLSASNASRRRRTTTTTAPPPAATTEAAPATPTEPAAAVTVHALGEDAKEFGKALDKHAGDPLALLQQYEDIASKQYESATSASSSASSTPWTPAQRLAAQAYAQSWLLERNTWMLLRLLSSERFGGSKNDTVTPPTSLDSDHVVVQKLFASSSQLREQMCVKEWLEATASPVQPIDARSEHWVHTKNSNAKHTQHQQLSLDPDGPLRQQNNKLHAEDQKYEQQLVRVMFEYMRRGQREDAEELCRRVGHSWRVASLRGSVQFRNPLLESGDAADIAAGNVNRGLWKSVCLNMVRDSSLDTYERALYGLLVGDVQSLAPVCTTWEDHVWALYSALLEYKVDQAVLTPRAQFPEPAQHDYGSKVAPLDPTQIFHSLLNSTHADLLHAANDPFRIVQVSLVLDSVKDMVTYGHSSLSSPSSPQFLRCLAHVILYLQDADAAQFEALDADPELHLKRVDILGAYVDLLIDQHMSDLVAKYSTKLPKDVRVKKFSRMLKGIAVGSHDKVKYYNLAKQNGLEWFEIALDLVVGTLEPALSGHGGGGDERESSATFIDVLEWLKFAPEHEEHMDELAAAVIRYFLAKQHLDHAFDTIARYFPSKAHLRTRPLSSELQGYVSFRAVQCDFREWERLQASKSSSSRKWQDESRAKTTRLQQELEVLLKCNLLANTKGEFLREIYIPHLLFQLHQVLFETRDHIPGNLEKSLRIVADLAADDEYLLHAVVGSEHMQHLLRLLRKSSLALLSDTGSGF